MPRARDPGRLVLDLVNTWDPYLADPELLPDPATFGRLLAEHGLDERVSERELEGCRALRARLLDIVSAGSAPELVSRLNDFIAELGCGAAVAQRADGSWALALQPPPVRRIDEQLAGLVASELIELVARFGPERIRQCQAAPCIEMFVDTSRNGRRSYCSHRCANRINAARHRRRRAAEAR